MKYLDALFNDKFTKPQSHTNGENTEKENHIIHDGLKFENLVESLLCEMYPEIGGWGRTKKTHDGSRDFFAQIQDKLMWAECKNYKDNIALSVIAPTLVMAQICNVDELFFFSSSPINENTKKKLCFYAHINKKMVHFYDGDVLEQLILNNKKTLNKYFKDLGIKVPEEIFAEPTVYNWLFKNPFLNNYKMSYEFDKTEFSLKYNDVFSISYAVINNDVLKPLEIKLTLNAETEDYDCFALLNRQDEDPESRNICIEKILEPNEMYFHSFNFRIIKYKSDIKLPLIQLSYVKAESVKKFPAIDKKIKCTWLGKAQLVGAQYENILKRIENEIINVKYLSGVLIYGSSGTGKTRLVEDSFKILLKNDYKVLNFIGITDDSGINVIKEIVYVLFELSEEFINFDALKNIIPIGSVAYNEVNIIVEFLQKLSQPDADTKKIIKDYGKIIFEKLACEKYVLIVDNLQYFDEDMTLFLEEMLRYGKNNNRDNWLSVILVINTDYTDDASASIKIKNLIEQLSSGSGCKFLTEAVDGFANPGISLEFLKQILRLKTEE